MIVVAEDGAFRGINEGQIRVSDQAFGVVSRCGL